MRTRRCMFLSVLLGWAAPALAASDYLESLAPGDLDYDLAARMEAQGCTMTEEEMLAFLSARGADVSMRQSVITDLAQLGDLRWDGRDSYTLIGWGDCA